MNDEQHAYWLAYIRQLADLLGLKDWRIELERQYVSNDGAAAECKVWPNQKGASILLSDWFMKQYTPEEQRETVAHELFHCHDYRLRTLVYEFVDKDDGKAEKLFLDMFEREYEQLCDGVAVAVAEFLTLPIAAPNPLPQSAMTSDPYEHRGPVVVIESDHPIAERRDSIGRVTRSLLSTNGVAP